MKTTLFEEFFEFFILAKTDKELETLWEEGHRVVQFSELKEQKSDGTIPFPSPSDYRRDSLRSVSNKSASYLP